MKLKIKKGDTVKVISGDSKGKTGRVIEIIAKDCRAIVEGVNIISRHTKPNAQNTQGGIIKKEAPIALSKLMLLVDGKATRIGRKMDGGKLVRFAKKTGEIIK